ncbi:MAG: hypothetical protein LBS01_04660 [Prevotellaceae bacterium]|jgi:hypothetical protein|nr:hypothetical protein [Prevotellaceae bacterium]
MFKDEEIPVYDDDELIQFTLNLVPEEFEARIDADKIQWVLDVVYDYYEEKGYIDEDLAQEASIDEMEMFEYIEKAAKKDKIDLRDEEIKFILDCEYDYGVSLGVYTEE